MGKLHKIPGIGGRGLTAEQEALLIGALQKSGGAMTGAITGAHGLLPLTGGTITGVLQVNPSAYLGIDLLRADVNSIASAGDLWLIAHDTTKLDISAASIEYCVNLVPQAAQTVDGVDIDVHTHSGAAGHGPNVKGIQVIAQEAEPAVNDGEVAIWHDTTSENEHWWFVFGTAGGNKKIELI